MKKGIKLLTVLGAIGLTSAVSAISIASCGGVSLDIKIDKVEVSGNKVSVSPDGTNIVFQSNAGDDDKVLYTFNKEVYGQYTETSIKLFFLALVTSSTLESFHDSDKVEEVITYLTSIQQDMVTNWMIAPYYNQKELNYSKSDERDFSTKQGTISLFSPEGTEYDNPIKLHLTSFYITMSTTSAGEQPNVGMFRFKHLTDFTLEVQTKTP